MEELHEEERTEALREEEIREEPLDVQQPEESPIQPRKRRQHARSRLAAFFAPIAAYYASIGKDVKWYFDIRLWSPLIVVLLILALLVGKGPDKPVVETTPETEAQVMETEPETTEPPTEEPIDPKAEALARLADTVGAGRSDNVKTVIMWVAINREEDRANGYGKTLLEEIARPSQWQGYDENAAYTDRTYEIAKQVLEIQAKGGLRPLDSDMLWFILNDDGSITVRNQFTATANQKWQEKTVK